MPLQENIGNCNVGENVFFKITFSTNWVHHFLFSIHFGLNFDPIYMDLEIDLSIIFQVIFLSLTSYYEYITNKTWCQKFYWYWSIYISSDCETDWKSKINTEFTDISKDIILKFLNLLVAFSSKIVTGKRKVSISLWISITYRWDQWNCWL